MTDLRFQVAIASRRGRGRFAQMGNPFFVTGLKEDEKGKVKSFRHSVDRSQGFKFSKFRAQEIAEMLILWGYQALPIREDVHTDDVNGLLSKAMSDMVQLRAEERARREAKKTPQQKAVEQEILNFVHDLRRRLKR